MLPSSHSKMCYGKSSYEPRLLPNPLSSQVAACSPEVVAYYSGCSSSHSSDCSDYSGYLSNTGLDSDSDTCFDMYYLQIVPAVVDSADSHTMLALLSSVLTENPYYCVALHKTRRYPKDYFESHSLYLAASVVIAV